MKVAPNRGSNHMLLFLRTRL